MATYLITWKPSRSPWPEFDSAVRDIATRGYVDERWSSGNRKDIRPGDRLFLLRQGSDHPGIIGSGESASDVYEAEHWDEERPNDTANYVDLRFDMLVHPEDVLPRSELMTGRLANVNWNTQSSGIQLIPGAALELEAKWQAHLASLGLEVGTIAEEVKAPESYFEGGTTRVSVNRYERSAPARRACIDHYGVDCAVCGLSFEQRYGTIGRGFIHVHHLVPRSQVGENYELNAVTDLRPVCPNCHAMLHRGGKTRTIDELKRAVASVAA